MGMKLINSAVVSGSSTYYVTFDLIPQTYKDLYITVFGRDSRTSARYGYLYLSFNNETINAGTNQFLRKVAYGVSGGQSYESSSAIAFSWDNATDYQTADIFGMNEVYIMDYSSSLYRKSARLFGGNSNNATGADSAGNSYGGLHWNDTTPITKINVACPSDRYLKAGTIVRLYGIS